ncbi:CPBP family glutamic-type intramembrane protease [Croceiramulus getboli]|nr:CPBP family glutamic-type intramembrane protease [Flavobacteriaceae bacterium YJPT1-3]
MFDLKQAQQLHQGWLGAEFLALFVLLPVSFSMPYPIVYKIGLTLAGFIYILIVLYQNEYRLFQSITLNWTAFWKSVGIRFIGIAIVTLLYVYWQDKSLLFFVPRNNPGLFGIIVLVYALLSVWPQEVIYRTFFFERYKHWFKDQRLLCFVNAIVFSLAHLFFRNTLVLLLTFLGGLLFAFTYLRFKSTLAVSVEHAIYGNWLFAIGMGEMLAFPGMEAP